jgi:hypothetical protein
MRTVLLLALASCAVSRSVLADCPWLPTVSDPVWEVPSVGLPADLGLLASNNNVALERFDGRLFMAWRNSPNHFASEKTRMIVVSSGDEGRTWEHEAVVKLGTDVREPFLLAFQGRLTFSFFQAGKNPFKFEPKRLLRIVRQSAGKWSSPEEWGEPGEIAWELKVRDGRAWATTYIGNHYGAGEGKVAVHFKSSTDGIEWNDVDPSGSPVYVGGVSEVGFDFDPAGNLFAVGRNEDGDSSGMGSLVFSAAASRPGKWLAPAVSNPNRYDSPRMFSHEGSLYLVARRDFGKPFGDLDTWMPFDLRKWAALAQYSLRPKRTALYRVNTESKVVEWIQDLPSAGDTAFAAIVPLDGHRFLIGNYTSPVEHGGWSWITGQTSGEGTQIYFSTITFAQTCAGTR